MVVVRAQGFDQRLQGQALRVEFHPENTNPSLSAVNRAVLPFFPGEALADAVLAPQAVADQLILLAVVLLQVSVLVNKANLVLI